MSVMFMPRGTEIVMNIDTIETINPGLSLKLHKPGLYTPSVPSTFFKVQRMLRESFLNKSCVWLVEGNKLRKAIATKSGSLGFKQRALFINISQNISPIFYPEVVVGQTVKGEDLCHLILAVLISVLLPEIKQDSSRICPISLEDAVLIMQQLELLVPGCHKFQQKFWTTITTECTEQYNSPELSKIVGLFRAMEMEPALSVSFGN